MPLSPQELSRFVQDPVDYFDWHYTPMVTIPRDRLEAMQLAGIRLRFEQLRDRIGYLEKLANSQDITGIDTLDDIVPLMFEHSVYKSYPASLLVNQRFDQLVRWIGKLTTVDLAHVDMTGCASIDEFLDRLHAQSDMFVGLSSGTSGTFSILPWAKDEVRRAVKTYAMFYQRLGEPRPAEPLPEVHIIWPSYDGGGLSHMQLAGKLCDALMGGDRRYLHCAIPHRLSADLSWFAGRIARAKLLGELDRLEVDPALLARLREHELGAGDREARLVDWLIEKARDLRGKRVVMVGTYGYLYPAAARALELGLDHMFAPDSLLMAGDARKGGAAPVEGWQEVLKAFVGVERMEGAYGMTEMSSMQRECTHGHYHFWPWLVPYLLDPDSSRPLPRAGVVTGRFAYFDLILDSHWGGFITGDEVTIHWDDPCPCGQRAVWAEKTIDRYSMKRGGDDKINCSAAADAHAEAMDYLARTNPEFMP